MIGRRVRAAAAGIAVAALAAGCATIPVAGRVRDGGSEVSRGVDVGFIATSPAFDADPDAIVRGFLLAAQAGPTSTTPFSVAREYLASSAVTEWRPYAQVVVLDGPVQLSTPESLDQQPDRAVVHASGTVVASLDERGAFTEEPVPTTKDTTFELTREGGQWRITSLEDGLLVPAQVFNATYHRTRLYFPTPDLKNWVPDVRWFPQQTWRTNAVQEILAGPPEWLGAAVTSLLPAGTALALNSVTEGPDGNLQVPLTEQVGEASGEARGLFAAQLRATLSDGVSEGVGVTLLDRNGPIVPPDDVELPSLPRTTGQALVLRDGKLWSLAGRELVESDVAANLDGLDPTALALGSGASTVVVRDGSTRIVRVTGDRAVLLEGADLLAPSVDRFGVTWSGERAGPVEAVLPTGGRYSVAAPWLEDRTVTSLSVAPDGARLAVVSTGPGGPAVQVAGIVRDQRGVPTALATPVTVGQSVGDVSQAVWQDEAALALLGQEDGAVVYLAGVGGLAGSAGGLARRLSGVSSPTSLSATVGTGSVLALDGQGVLYLHQSSAVWPVVAQGVTLAAFPG
ncbi:hypothetical protein ET495_08815 [Xylanimonas allomyrinae]|uniref:GerMN domain-containing protein n=1 Tax=Xylanimonas allomyrinae TaxID=2509459 RepID=A0A4P6ENM6_9MICO|nr:LpqB family beta-propeller domain-containing protein [Xylanimonas allomyrinae]QAY63333.1 hypothetical protein ET495_08815 [Xylanimonas allomyrinae]